MVRLSALSGLAALMLAVAPAWAQETGGIQLAPAVLNTPDAQQQAVNLALSLLQQMQVMQQLQQSHGMVAAPASAAAASPRATAPFGPNAVNPAAGRSSVNQQAVANMLGDPGYLAGFSGGRPLAASRLRPPPATGQAAAPQLVVNAVDSPVSIGNGNIVHQQVANSTAIGRGATASSGAVDSGGVAARGHRRGAAGHSGSVSQDASSLAVSQGGVADATASNSNIVQR